MHQAGICPTICQRTECEKALTILHAVLSNTGVNDHGKHQAKPYLHGEAPALDRLSVPRLVSASSSFLLCCCLENTRKKVSIFHLGLISWNNAQNATHSLCVLISINLPPSSRRARSRDASSSSSLIRVSLRVPACSNSCDRSSHFSDCS